MKIGSKVSKLLLASTILLGGVGSTGVLNAHAEVTESTTTTTTKTENGYKIVTTKKTEKNSDGSTTTTTTVKKTKISSGTTSTTSTSTNKAVAKTKKVTIEGKKYSIPNIAYYTVNTTVQKNLEAEIKADLTNKIKAHNYRVNASVKNKTAKASDFTFKHSVKVTYNPTNTLGVLITTKSAKKGKNIEVQYKGLTYNKKLGNKILENHVFGSATLQTKYKNKLAKELKANYGYNSIPSNTTWYYNSNGQLIFKYPVSETKWLESYVDYDYMKHA